MKPQPEFGEAPKQATRDLPENYVQIERLDLLQDKRLMMIMNLLGVALFVLSAWVFNGAAHRLHPEAARHLWQFSTHNRGDFLKQMGGLLGILAVLIFLHEGTHGLFFWIYTRSKPQFEFKIVYAAASAPGWYFPPKNFAVIGLAPFILLSLLGVAALWLVPSRWLPALTLFLTLNASGSVGDLVVVGWMATRRHARLALDETTAVSLFATPEEPTR